MTSKDLEKLKIDLSRQAQPNERRKRFDYVPEEYPLGMYRFYNNRKDIPTFMVPGEVRRVAIDPWKERVFVKVGDKVLIDGAIMRTGTGIRYQKAMMQRKDLRHEFMPEELNKWAQEYYGKDYTPPIVYGPGEAIPHWSSMYKPTE